MDAHKDFGSNSYRSRETRNEDDTRRKPRCGKVADGVKIEHSKTSSIADIFFPDGIDKEELWNYILKERLVPGLMSGIRSLLDDVLDGIFGTPKKKSGSGIYYSSDRNHTPYSSLYRSVNKDKNKDKDNGKWRKGDYTYADVAFETRAKAEEVFEDMKDALEKYDVLSIADYYDMSGLEAEPTDSYYGWTSLKNAKVERISGGYFTIKLPRATPID